MVKTLIFGISSLALGTGAAQAQSIPSASTAEPRPAAAEQVEQSSASDQGDIVVTARRTAERLQDVPLAISALSGDGLQRQAITELKNLSSVVPNLSIQPANAGGSGVQVTLRGQSQSNVGLLYIDPAVGIYVDSLNVPRNFGLRSGLVDIQRVEVLRGPQGTLYGRNTTGGAIGILTNDPNQDLGASFQATYGNYNAWGVNSVLNVPLNDDAAMRFVVSHTEHDGYGKQVTTGVDLNTENSTYLRGKLKYEHGAFRASITADYFRYESSGTAFKVAGLTPASATESRYSGRVCIPTAALGGADPSRLGGACTTGGVAGSFYGVAGGAASAFVQRAMGLALTPANLDIASASLSRYVGNGSGGLSSGFYDTFGTNSDAYNFPAEDNSSRSKGGSVVANLEGDLTDSLTLRSVTGWRHYSRSDHFDIDGTPYTMVEPINGTPFNDYYSEELQLLGRFSRFNFVVGGFGSLERGLDYTPSASLQAAGQTNYGLADGLSRNTSKAVFAQGTYQITDKLNLTLGARYTWDGRRINNRNRFIATSGAETCGIPLQFRDNPAFCEGVFRTNYKAPSWLVSLDYKAFDDVLFYAKFARGFRSGGVQGRANSAGQPLSFTPFAPEYVSEYEGGVKADLFDRLLRVNLAAYWDDYSGVQRSITLVDPVNGNYTLVSNAAKARLYGFEGELSVKVTPELRLNSSFGYLNAKYKQFFDATLGDRSAEDWPAPKFIYTIGASYIRDTGFGSFSASVDWNHRSSENLQPQGLLRSQNTQAPYGILNGRLGITVKDADLDISVFGRNLLKKEYYTGGISLESLGLNTLIAGDPRVVGIQLTKRFGAFR